MKTHLKQLLYGILVIICLIISCTSLTLATEEFQWPPRGGEHIITLLGPIYEAGRETKAPLFKALEQAMTAIVENQQKHLPEFYQQRIAGMNHQLFRPGYSNDEEWGSIKSLSSKAEDYDPESMAGILETSEYRKPGLEMAIRMQPTIDPQPASVMLEGYRFVLQPSGKGQAEWFTQEVKLKGRKAGEAFRNALIWQLSKPFEKAQKTFVLDDWTIPVWKDKNTAGVLTFANKEFTADAEPIRKEVVEVCVHTGLCPEIKMEGDEFVLVSNFTDAQTICRIFGRELIDKETLLRLSLTEEGSNLLDEENGVAWNSGGYLPDEENGAAWNSGGSGFFEENYYHLDFITVIPSETTGRSQSGVVWCRSAVRDTFYFLARPDNFVMDRGWRTIDLYNQYTYGVTGVNILDEELVVEFLENDELYPLVKYGRILDNSFSDVANQGERVSVRVPQSRFVFGISYESYPIDVILSGNGWERKISNVPVRRFGIVPSEIYGGESYVYKLGLSSPGLDVNVISEREKESITGGIAGGYANVGFGDYLKLLPNIKWNVSFGIERLNILNNQSDTEVNLLLLGFDARLLFQYKMVGFYLGQIIHPKNFNPKGRSKSFPNKGESEPLIKSVNIPAGTSLLIGMTWLGLQE